MGERLDIKSFGVVSNVWGKLETNMFCRTFTACHSLQPILTWEILTLKQNEIIEKMNHFFFPLPKCESHKHSGSETNEKCEPKNESHFKLKTVSQKVIKNVF